MSSNNAVSPTQIECKKARLQVHFKPSNPHIAQRMNHLYYADELQG
jgi:hypothetical protein